jgi:hypothetical protein
MENLNTKTELNQFVQAFKVYKIGRAIGTTEPWQTILIPKSEFTNELLNKKMNFYKSLGYTVKAI